MFHMLSFFKKKKTYNSKLSYPGQAVTTGFRDQEKGGEDGRMRVVAVGEEAHKGKEEGAAARTP